MAEPIKDEADRTPKAPTQEKPLTTAELAGSSARPATTKPMGEPRSFADGQDAETAPLLPGDEAEGLRDRWDAIQAGFVDEPRKAVKQADELVAAAMKRLAEVFADERTKLEGQWDRGEDVSTEDLRLSLRRYRAFFGRLLSV